MTTQPTPRRRTQQERRDEAERRLLEAAAQLIAESGTAAVTLAAVGERAGYSRGIVGHHFGTKATLMGHLVDAVHREFFQSWSEAVDPSEAPTDQLRSLLAVFSGLLQDLPPIHRAFLVLWADAAGAPPDIRANMATSDRIFRASIADIVLAGQTSGEFCRDRDASALAASIAGTLRGVALQLLIDPEGIDVVLTLAEFERALLLSLLPQR